MIGNSAEIGYYAKIGYYAEIGNSAKTGDYAEIGNSAKIGDYAEIGYYAKIGKENLFSAYSLFYHLGVYINKDTVILYKAIKNDLTAYNDYQYKIGGEDNNENLKPDQSINCGEGWHFTNLEKAIEWAKKENLPKIISAEINIKDILYISWKVRVRAYKNVKLVDVDYLLK